MSAPKITSEFIRAIPKSDLHVHLDGSLRLSTLIALAKAQTYAEKREYVRGVIDYYETIERKFS